MPFNPGLSWHLKGAEDFNGDGNADILWQHDSGQGHIWLMNGATVLSQQNAGARRLPEILISTGRCLAG